MFCNSLLRIILLEGALVLFVFLDVYRIKKIFSNSLILDIIRINQYNPWSF